MLTQLKEKMNSVPVESIKKVAKEVAITIVVATAVKAGTYILVEGTKALITEIGNRKSE